MKSLLKKVIHTALGAADAGMRAADQLAAKLARQASLSEHKGAILAKRLRKRTSSAVLKLEKQFASDVNKAVAVLHKRTLAEVRHLSRNNKH